MKKINFEEVKKIINEHNEKHNINRQFSDNTPIYGVVVFKKKNWLKAYSLKSRSYKFRNDNNAFIKGLISNSIFADNLDETDNNIRLDKYLHLWKVDYCYIVSGKRKKERNEEK